MSDHGEHGEEAPQAALVHADGATVRRVFGSARGEVGELHDAAERCTEALAARLSSKPVPPDYYLGLIQGRAHTEVTVYAASDPAPARSLFPGRSGAR
jgi:hypothetical protein